MAACGLLLAFASSGTAQDREGLRPSDHYRSVEVSDPALSPAGDRIAYTITRAIEDENRRRSEVWVQDLDRGRAVGRPVRVTSPGTHSHSPRWSPDGSLLSFVSSRGDDPNPIWFVRMNGPGGEAFHLEGVDAPPVWSPDGSWIAFLQVADSATGAAKRIAPDAVTETVDSTRFAGHVITHLPYRERGSADILPHPDVAPRPQVFVVPAGGGTPRQLTDLDLEIGDLTWGPDGERLYFAAGRHLDRPEEPGAGASLWRVSREEGDVIQVIGGEGIRRRPAVSPDGDHLAFLEISGEDGRARLRVGELGSGGALASVPAAPVRDFDRSPGPPHWVGGSDEIAFAVREGGARHLFRVPAEGGSPTPVTAGLRYLEDFTFDADRSLLGYVASDASTPPEVHVSGIGGRGEERITGVNREWSRDVTLRPSERLTWRSDDSTRIEGWVLPPASLRPEGGHPLVVVLPDELHGSSGHRFRLDLQMLSGAGFFVLHANPRGASGYGADFERAVRGAWGMIEAEDLTAGVRAALEKYPQAARERVGVVGHGYGGFLATWLTATTDRFTAAVASAPAVDWESWFGSSVDRRLAERELGGPPWSRRNTYRRLSPFSYVENVTTPTLLLVDEQDRVHPPADAERWFATLRRRSVPAELVRYPGASHDPAARDPWQVVDRLERTRSWLRHWLDEGSLLDRLSEIPR